MTAPAMPAQILGRPVVEMDWGITVYPARFEGDRWRATWHENGRRRQCEARTEERLAARLKNVTERLAAAAFNMERPGAELIAHYLDSDRLPIDRRWSRKHADTQRRLCDRFAAPMIGDILCQDITTRHMQQVINAAPTAGEGTRVHGMISALVTAGIAGGFLVNPRLKDVHWQPGERPLPTPKVTVARESPLWVDPAEIPAADDVARLGKALTAGPSGKRNELMANAAAYSGLRWGRWPPLPSTKSMRAPVSSTWTARWSRSRAISTLSHPRAASAAGLSIHGSPRLAIHWLNGSPPASKRPSPSRRLAITRSD